MNGVHGIFTIMTFDSVQQESIPRQFSEAMGLPHSAPNHRLSNQNDEIKAGLRSALRHLDLTRVYVATFITLECEKETVQ